MLIKSKILCIKGERDKNSLYDIETVSFEINPLITKFFNADIDDKQFSAKEILYTLKRKNLLQYFSFSLKMYSKSKKKPRKP